MRVRESRNREGEWVEVEDGDNNEATKSKGKHERLGKAIEPSKKEERERKKERDINKVTVSKRQNNPSKNTLKDSKERKNRQSEI